MLLFAISFGALVINPTPFPYNLVNLAPFALLVAFRYSRGVLNQIAGRPQLLPFAGALVIFTHFVPFWTATRRHLDMPSTRQERLMSLAEDLTDAKKDPVYDAIGMVPTRPIIDPRGFLHSLSIRSFRDGTGPQVRDMLAKRPATVFIPSYRTDWLPEADNEFIRRRYVALAGDFWILGKVIPLGGGNFEIFHAGRYRITPIQNSGLSGTYLDDLESLSKPSIETVMTGKIDGKPITDRPIELAVGMHYLECDSATQPTVVWIGPRLDRLPQLGRGDHQKLFSNWY
jgi:hypothetical protein